MRATRRLWAAAARAAPAAAAPPRGPRYSRRPLNRADYFFALAVGFVAFPAAGLLYFNARAVEWAAPYYAAVRAAARAAEADVWLSLERLGGREGELSEGIRRHNAARRGEAYVPAVAPPPPTAPSRDEVRRLLRRPSEAAGGGGGDGGVGGGGPWAAAGSRGGSVDLDALVAAANRQKQQQR